MCLTYSYGRYVEGTGSVLQCCMETEVSFGFSRGINKTEQLWTLSEVIYQCGYS